MRCVRMHTSNRRIRAVTLDLWQTLLLDGDGASAKRNVIRCNNLSGVLEQMGIRTSTARLTLILAELSSWLASVWAADREVTHSDQVRFILERASGGAVSTMREEWFERLSSAYVSPIFECPPYLNPETPHVLRWLRETGKGIGLISNTGMTPGFILRQVLRKEGVADFFDVLLFSDEVGVRKPERAIFDMVVEKLRAKSSEVVHIGDDLRSDVWGAKNAGFRAIHLSTDIGRDKIAESDPSSLVSVTMRISSGLRRDGVVSDMSISSLGMAIEAIGQLDF
jgi:putative hydrolase of the HAD superfamily